MRTRAQILHYLFQMWQTRDLGRVDHYSFCWRHLTLGLNELACRSLADLKLFNVLYLSIWGMEGDIGTVTAVVHSDHRHWPALAHESWALYHSPTRVGGRGGTTMSHLCRGYHAHGLYGLTYRHIWSLVVRSLVSVSSLPPIIWHSIVYI